VLIAVVVALVGLLVVCGGLGFFVFGVGTTSSMTRAVSPAPPSRP